MYLTYKEKSKKELKIKKKKKNTPKQIWVSGVSYRVGTLAADEHKLQKTLVAHVAKWLW